MSVEKVRAALAGTALENKIIVLQESSATVALAAQALHTDPDRIAKTLSFLIGEEAILIVASGETKVDNRKFKDTFGTKARMIPWEEVEERTGHAPGGVCPFGRKEGVRVYLDQSLKKYDVVYPAAGDAASAVEATIAELEACSGYEKWVDIGRE